MRKQVIVTGNLGYLGPIVVKKLKSKGYLVVGVDIELYPAEIPFDYLPDLQVSKVDEIASYLWDPTAVVHLAGLSNDPLGDISPAMTYAVNTRMVGDIAAVFPDAKHVLASSASVYGFNDGESKNNVETDPLNPLTSYADSKVKAERVIDFINANSAMLRFATLWGDSPNFRTDLVVNAFAVEAAKSNTITPKSNAKRPLLHVEDAADAIVKVVESAREEYVGVYNICGENTQVWDIANKLGAKLNCTVNINETLKDAVVRSYHLGTFKTPHLCPAEPITLTNDEAITRLSARAAKSIDKPSRLEQYHEHLAWITERTVQEG
jgi:nucleoside-diphosphate-sugar epimerase